MTYQPRPYGREDALKALSSNDESAICHALVGIAVHDPDWRWVQSQCAALAGHRSPGVRGVVATCIGHLARIHGEVDRAVVDPILDRLAADGDAGVRGSVEDARVDFRVYLKRPPIQSDSGRFISYAQVRERSLEELLPLDPQPGGESHVASETRRLRRVPLKELRIEDLRFLIEQGVGLPFLMPMAIAQLEAHPLAAGDLHPGDLLKQVIGVDEPFWVARRDLRTRLRSALELALERIGAARVPVDLETDLRAALARHNAALRSSAR